LTGFPADRLNPDVRLTNERGQQWQSSFEEPAAKVISKRSFGGRMDRKIWWVALEALRAAFGSAAASR